jgi:Na+-transporting NADH:ubiquinone oxidoreductase subunit C
MLLFVIILGSITSGLLLGMDYLTRDRIAANKEAELKSTLLDAYDISYTFNNIHEVFAESVQIIETEGYTFYVDRLTGSVSYIFEGGGVWGPIKGIITLESDFETILSVTILEQEETPGLGGVVAESEYLSRFVGIKMVPSILIANDSGPNAENEVDAITGATRTSKAFELILNQAYTEHLLAWQNYND